MYRLLVIDVDGTLLNEQNVVSDEDRKAIDEARRLGVVVSLCTGRVNQACQTVLRCLSLNGYHIFSDGAVVGNADNSEQIYTRTIEDGVLGELVDYVHENSINTIDFFSPKGYYIEPKTEEWLVTIRTKFFGLDPTVIDFSELCRRREKIIKATLIVNPGRDKAKAVNFISRFKDKVHLSWTANVTYPELDWINIIDPGVSKAEAMRFLASYLNVPMNEVIAIGDGKNDIPLLTCAGLSVAMGHAPEEVKKCAHYVTLDVAHSGVAAAVRKFLI